MNDAVFELLVAEAVDSLPEEFKAKLDNVDVVIEDLPSVRQLASLGLRHPLQLFGLYQGVPKTKRGSNYTFVAPDKITVFKVPILTFYRTPEAVRAKVRAVVLHEIGHHFGLSEEDLARRPRAQ